MTITIIPILLIFLLFCNSSYALEPLKKTVAVFDFQNDSGWVGSYKLGRDFGAQLSNALVQSGKFIVLTRQDLAPVLAEQDMASSDRFAQTKESKTGKLIPAQILIKGKITEFQEHKSDGRQGFKFYGVSVKTSKSSAHVAVVIELIDSTSGEILDSKRVEGDYASGGASLGYSGLMDFNSSDFQKTPLGKAVQMTIDKGVSFISSSSTNIGWSSKVMLAKDGVIYINAGTNAGLRTGNTFYVYKAGELLIDPDTGISLGQEIQKIGEVKIIDVQEKYSKAQVVGVLEKEVSKGDIIKEK